MGSTSGNRDVKSRYSDGKKEAEFCNGDEFYIEIQLKSWLNLWPLSRTASPFN